MWIYPYAWVDEAAASSHHLYPNADGFGFVTTGSNWQYWVKNGSSRQYRTVAHNSRLNEWHHIAISYNPNSGNMRFYWNGELKDNYNLTASAINWSTSSQQYIGGVSTSYTSNATIDEVKIWGRVLSPEEINASYSAGVWKLYHNFTSLTSGNHTYKAYVVDQAGNMNSTGENVFIVNAVPVVSTVLVNSTSGTNLTTENLTAYVTASEADSDGYTLIYNWRKNGISDAVLNMPFDINGSNGNTSNVKDYTSFGNNGTANNIRWNASCGAFAGSGGCYEFNGIGRINIPENANQRLSSQGSLAAWINIKGFNDFQGIITKTEAGGIGQQSYYLSMGYGSTAKILRLGLSPAGEWGSAITTTSNLTENIWYHVVGTWNPTGAFLYVNGAQNSSGIAVTAQQNSSHLLRIGASFGDGYFFNGSIEQVQIFNRSLSSSEVAMIYNAGAGMYNRTHSDATTNGDVWYVVVTPADKYEDGTSVASNNVTIAGSATSVTLTSPLDNWYVNNTVKFECLASSNIPLVNVSLWHNNTGTWARNATVTTTANSAIAHFTVTGLSTTNFIWTCIACTAESCTASTENRTLLVDVTKPVIEFHSSSVENNTKRATNYNNAYVNTTITDVSNNYSAFIDWNRSLVGWWRFENTNGTWFEDSSTWGNNGTCTGTSCPNLTMGMRGKAYRFDGSNDVITTSSFASPTSAMTIELWAKSSTDNWNSYGMLASKRDSFVLHPEPDTKAINFFVYIAGVGWANTLYTSTKDLKQWHHYAGTYDGATLRIYEDGELKAVPTNSAGTINSDNSSMTIGQDDGIADRFFNGSIDEVMLWNRALSPEEINASYSAGVWKLYHNFTSLSSGTYTYKAYVVDQAGNLNNTEQRTFIVNAVPVVSSVIVNSTSGTNLTTENLTAYVTASENDSDGYTLIYNWRKNGISDAMLNLPFDINGSNGNTSNVKDYTSYSNNGSLYGSRWNSSCGAFTGSGGCYEFSGSGEHILGTNSPFNFNDTTFTVSAWFKTNASSGVIISEGAYSTGGWAIWYNSGTLGAFMKEGSATAYTITLAAGAYSDGNWHHMATVMTTSTTDYTANLADIYIDGAERTVGIGSQVKNYSSSPDSWSIGSRGAGASTYFNGSIDQAMIWNRSLSASEISMFYNSGIGMYNRTHSDATTNGDVWYVVVTPADKYEDGTSVASNNVTIADSATSVTLTSPLDSWYVNNTVKFECLASSNIPLINVSLWHNNTGAWARNATVTTTATSAIAHYTVTGLQVKNVIWTCLACTAEGCTYSATNRTLLIDITNPDIEFHASSELNATKKSTANNFAYINTTITEMSNNMSAFIDWNRSLVGWWRLENDNGTFFADSSTWGRNGTCTTTACPNLTTGMRGKAYRFDGSNDYITVTNGFANTISGDDSHTVSIWFKANSLSNSPVLLSNSIGTYFLEVAPTAIYWYVGGTFRSYPKTYPLDTWNHISIVKTSAGDNGNLYFNGQLLTYTDTIGSTPTSSSDLLMGKYSSGSYFFNGSIDEVMIWNRALSAEEVNATYSAGVWKLYHNFTGLSSGTYTYKAYVVDQAGNLNNTEERTFIINTIPTQDYPTVNTTLGTNKTTENITAFNWSTADYDNDAVTNIWNWYRNGKSITVLEMPFEMNGSAGNTSKIKDYSTFSNNGTVYGARFTSAGKSGSAYYFDGTDDYIDLGNPSALNANFTQITLEAWVMINATPPGEPVIVGKGAGVKYSLTYYLDGKIYFYIYTGSNFLGSAMSLNAWHHVVGTFNGTGKVLYIDGAQVAINATDSYGATGITTLSAFIGGNYGGNYLNGSIDEVRIYNATLTAAQVAAIYNGGMPRYDRIESSMTSSGETWSACLTPNDGYDDGATMCTRANITINTAPSKVILAEPTFSNTTMTNRSVSFRWIAATDADAGQTLTYNLSIRCYKMSGGSPSSCSPSDDRMYNTAATTYNLTEATELRYVDNEYVYNWSVQAYDGFEYGEISNQSNFTIMSEVILSLINDSVNFSVMNINGMDNTTDFDPYPFRIENKGNVLTTVNLSYATNLFSAGGNMPNEYYQIRVNKTSGYEGAFNETGSQMLWAEIPQVNHTLFNMLNYSTGNDRGDIHLYVKVPNDQPAGPRSSILTLMGWSVAI
jgi:hypothetical protein